MFDEVLCKGKLVCVIVYMIGAIAIVDKSKIRIAQRDIGACLAQGPLAIVSFDFACVINMSQLFYFIGLWQWKATQG